MNRLIGGLVFVILVGVTGCGGEKFPRGKVTGKITYQGQPLTDTTMIFLTKDNMTYRAELDKQGGYSLDNIPLGLVKVSFQQAVPRVPKKADPDLSGKAGAEKKDAIVPPSEPILHKFQLPNHYTNPTLSGVTFELNQPIQEWSIDLK